jgi:nucleoside-diphosphate-sugar epimerase
MVIAGASGVVGAAVLDRMLQRDDWDVVALSRRPPETANGRAFRHVAVDLRDRAATAAAVAAGHVYALSARDGTGEREAAAAEVTAR